MRPPIPYPHLLLAALLTLGMVLALFPTVAAQERAVLTGRLVNGTADSPPPSGVTVSLHTLADTGGLASNAEAVSDASGEFRFEDIPITGISSYALVADYQGMRYNALLGPEDLAQPLEITVYDATQDLSVVQIEQQALIIADIREQKRRLAAVGLLNLANRSDRTLVPDLTNLAGAGEFSFLRFSLPTGAEELDVQTDLTGGQVIPMGTGFAMVAPIAPGEHSISYTFSFPYDEGAVTYRDGLIQGAAVYQVLAPRKLGDIQVSPLEPRPTASIGGSDYRVWEGRDFAPGQDLMVTLSQLPQSGPLSQVGNRLGQPSFWHVAIPVAVGVVLAFSLLYGGLKAPRGALAEATDALEDTAPADREALVQSVATLDEQFQRGQLSQAEHQARREELKARILGDGP